ncbi:MAG: peptide deformylase [Acutalibacteraceae bacterium]|nr:peptide deformylase [Acutalibacteraceae bacterium]
MATRNITQYGKDPILKKVCRSQLSFDDRLATILDDMAETMYAADGVGLAAPQVGILRRYCVIDVGEGIVELINPVIVEVDGEQLGQEGCLSVPGVYKDVKRPMKVKVRAQNRNGENIVVEGEGLMARALCHEIDHLDGVVFLDRAEK